MHSKVSSFFSVYAHRRSMSGALVIILCGLTIPCTSSAVQESGLVSVGSVRPQHEGLYAYAPTGGRYPNVFREQGRTFAVVLIASYRNGKYVNDRVGVWELTNPNDIQGWDFAIQVSKNDCCSGIEVSFENRDNVLWFSVSHAHSSKLKTYYEAPVKALYQWRAQTAKRVTACGREYLSGVQGGETAAFTFFDPSISRYLDGEPPDNFRLLAPLYVAPHKDVNGRRLGNRIPIGDTGCSLCWQESQGGWSFCPNR